MQSRIAWSIAIAVCLAPAIACGRAPAQPHLVLITVDTLRADRVGCYGDDSGATPEIDRLCAESARFDPALSPAPLTLPAHATIMTGLLPPAHGLRNNGAFALAPQFTTIAEVLASRGYATAAFVAALPLERRTGLDQGFAVYDDDLPSGRGDFGYAERSAPVVIDRALSWWRQSRPRASAWRQLGLLHLSERRVASAVEALETAHRLSEDPDTLFALGEAYRQSGDLPRSRELFRAFLTTASADDDQRRRYASDHIR